MSILIKTTLAAVLLVSCTFVGANLDLKLNLLEKEATDHYLLNDACLNVLNEHVGWELYASVVYLNMAGYFDRPSVARLGYGKFFKDQSKEEYEHATKFIEYITKRNGVVKPITIEDSPKSEWNSPKDALADAIKLEKHVYAKIQHIHSVAEQQCNDAHLTDFLEGYFFTEQVDSISQLTTMFTKLDVSDPGAASVIDYLEDARLRKDEL